MPDAGRRPDFRLRPEDERLPGGSLSLLTCSLPISTLLIQDELGTESIASVERETCNNYRRRTSL